MRIFYPDTITETFLEEIIANRIEGKVLYYQIISAKRIKEPYQIKNGDYAEYLTRVKEITEEVGGFIKGYLPVFSTERRDFNYIQKKHEFLTKHEILLKLRVETDKGDKLLKIRVEQPSFVLIPIVLFKAHGQAFYITDHYNSKISYVIGDPENPRTDDHLVDNAMEELWHVALYPYLVEKENISLKKGKPLDDKNFKKMLVKEGERLSRLFTFASIDEFRLKKSYESIKSERRVDKKEEFLLQELKRMGIKRAVKEVRKSKGILDFRR